MKHSTILFKAITALVLTALVFATLPMNSVKADITTGLILHWTFDEGTGTSVADSSGSGLTGTIVGTRFSWSTDVPPGIGSSHSIYFDGLNNSNTWVQSAPSGLFPSGASSRTLCAWAKSRDGILSTSAEHMVNYGTATNGNAFGFMIFTGNRWWFYGHGTADINSGLVPNTVWNHQCATYDGTTANYYLNGTLIASAPRALNTTANTRMVVGERVDFPVFDRFFDGWVDDVRLYNRALTAADVTQIYSGFSLNVSGNYNYTPSSPAINISSALTATSNPVNQNVNGATVVIGTNFNAGDTLAVAGYTSPSNGISWSYNAATGVLAFVGNSSISNYQTLLQAVTFSSTSAVLAVRTVTFSLGAGLPYSGNGHYYEFVSNPVITWADSNTAASGRTYFGRTGYLATITSAGENAFIMTKMGGADYGWFGASDTTTEATWKWVTGPEAGTTFCIGNKPAVCVPQGGAYTNWDILNPSNSMLGDPAGEDFIHLLPGGEWNDWPNGGSAGLITGYIVEYGGLPSDDLMPISGNVTVNVTNLLTVPSHTLQATYTGTGPSSFTVTFSEDVGVTGGATGTDSATNPANYRIINKGANGVLETTACNLPLGGDDLQVLAASGVTYLPNTAIVNIGSALPAGSYRLFVCGTTSIVNLAGLPLAGNGTTSGTDFTFDFIVATTSSTTECATCSNTTASALPATGFAPNKITALPAQPANLEYAKLDDIVLEIPALNVKSNIVGVPQNADKTWDVTWLGNDTGWLNGTAFPTWTGNSVLTAHVTNASGLEGPFAALKSLKYGDQIIVHMGGVKYVYEVRVTKLAHPYSTSFAFESKQDASYLTLVTCSGYNSLNETYLFRRVVRAVLVSANDE